MANEQFIELIRARPSLWDRNSMYYFNTILKDQEWNEVATEMNLSGSGPEARYKWKCLRDSFNREWRKPEIRNNSSKAKWIHFKSMLFLKDVLLPRSRKASKASKKIRKNDAVRTAGCSTSSFDESLRQESIPISINNENDGHLNLHSYEEMNGFKIPKEEPIVKEEENHAFDKMVESDNTLEKQESNFQKDDSIIFSNSEMDGKSDDHHFLLSLLPTLQDLPLQKKMTVKLEIQKLLYEATFNTPVILNPSSIWISDI